MRRLGLFSGTVYSSEDFENDRIKECAVQIPEKMKDTRDPAVYPCLMFWQDIAITRT